MNRNYYLFNPGRLRRQQNTILFERYKQVTEDKVIADFEEALENEPEFREEEPEVNYEAANEKKVIPIEDIDSLYVFGEADFNKKFLNYCGQKHIPLHLFNYYGFYAGTFYPREFLNSGELLIRQVQAQLDKTKRLELARAFVSGAAGNIIKNLQYYNGRGKDCSPFLNDIAPLLASVAQTGSIDELMGLEGNIRQIYYRA